MRLLPILLALLLAGCTDPGPGADTPAGSGVASEPAGDGAPREAAPEGMEWYQGTLVPTVPLSPTEDDLASHETRWGYAAQVRRHCSVPAPAAFGAGETGFLHRDDGAPDDPVTRMANALDVRAEQVNATYFRLGALNAEWDARGTMLWLWAPPEWDANQTTALLDPFLGNATHDPDRPGTWVHQSWYDEDHLLRHEVARLEGGRWGYRGSIHGPLPDGPLLELDAAWEATRGYGVCADGIGWPWDWDGWSNATTTADVSVRPHDGRLLYGFEFEDRYGQPWFFHVDAHRGDLYSA